MVDSQSFTPHSRDSIVQVCGEAFSPRPRLAEDPILNLSNMELLHYFCTVTYKTMTLEPAQQLLWQSTSIEIGLSFPFLLYEILAIAALHLAQCRPERQSHYYTQATELQSHALNGFTAAQRKVDSSNCAAILLFSSLLPVHILADRSRTRGIGFGEHLDHFISCVSLMQSVHHIVISDWWQYLKESELKPLLDVPQPNEPYNIPDQCRRLTYLVKNADLGPASIKAYERAVDRLQWIFAASQAPVEQPTTIQWLMGWPAQLTDEYIGLLKERRPEALIILAYYGVLLHFYRKSWAVGDSGSTLIKAIREHTGYHWEEWMAWPNRIICELP